MAVKVEGTCKTGRARYPTEQIAGEALAYVRKSRIKRGRTENMEKRWYACHLCRGYHLTAQDKRKFPPTPVETS